MVALAALAAVVFFALRQALDIPLNQADGAYQTASGLFRLSAGQFPGRDFFPYLGSGLIYMLYPLYKLAGENFSATVFASYCATALTTCFGIGLVSTLLARKNRRHVFFVSTIISLLLATAMYGELPSWATSRIVPGNSLRPIRSFIPYLCAGLALWTLRSSLHDKYKALALCAVSALAVAWSNDYGVPTAIMFGIFALAWSYRKLGARWIVLTPVAALVIGLLILTAATAGHPINIIKYNLAVSSEQSWYFACWDRSCRILKLSDYLRNFLRPAVGMWALVLPATWIAAVATRSRGLTLLSILGTCLLAGGSIAAVGGHIEYEYGAAFRFWCQTVFVCIFFVYAVKRVAFRLLVAACAVAAIAALSVEVGAYHSARSARENRAELMYSQQLGGFVPLAWKNHLDAALANGNSITEDYWGIWGAVNHKPGAYPVDSIIHALGFVRERYKKMLAMNSGNQVITADPELLGYFTAWTISSNWWFYRSLFKSYDGHNSSPTTVLWSKGIERDWPSTTCTVVAGKGVLVNSGALGYYEVDIVYRAHLRRGNLLFIRNNLNYAVDAFGYVALPPRFEGHMTFPAANFKPGEVLDLKSFTNFDKLSLYSCEARKLVSDAPRYFPPISPNAAATPPDLTDGKWLRGVHRTDTAFLLANTQENRDKFKKDVKVQFFDGRSETISHRIENPQFLEIYLYPNYPLNGGQGYPREVKAVP